MDVSAIHKLERKGALYNVFLSLSYRWAIFQPMFNDTLSGSYTGRRQTTLIAIPTTATISWPQTRAGHCSPLKHWPGEGGGGI